MGPGHSSVNLHPHQTRTILKRLLPEAHVSGGSFAEILPHPKKFAPEERRSKYEEVRNEATQAMMEDLLRYTDIKLSPPLDRDSSGKRIWPDGHDGSLTDKGAVVLGALVNECEVQSIGIDLELNENDGEMLGHTVRDGETPPSMGENVSVLAGFSVKEAAYKAFYSLEQRVIDFDDIRLTWEDRSKSINQGKAECPASVNLAVRCTCQDDWVISTALSGIDE